MIDEEEVGYWLSDHDRKLLPDGLLAEFNKYAASDTQRGSYFISSRERFIELSSKAKVYIDAALARGEAGA